MGGFFGVTSKKDCVFDLFFGVDYHSHLGTRRGGMAVCSENGFTRAIHNIMVEHGYNVSVWAHEGGYKAWWAQLRAIHFEYLYIRNADPTKRVAPLSQKEILYGNYPSEEIKALEEQSRLDLFTNPNYGVAYMIDRPFKVETFIDEVETSVQLNNSKAVLTN